jgi:hypothetical protein
MACSKTVLCWSGCEEDVGVTEDGVVLAFASDCRPIVSHASNLPNVVEFVGKRALTAIASRWYQGSTSQQCWRLSALSPLMVVGGASHGTCDASVVPPRACGHQRDHARLRRSPTELWRGAARACPERLPAQPTPTAPLPLDSAGRRSHKPPA